MTKSFVTFAIFVSIFFVLVLGVNAQEIRTNFVSGDAPLTPPSSRAAGEIARDYLVSAAGQMSISAQDLEGLFVVKEYTTAHNGVTHLVYKQQFQGIEVFNAEWVTNLDRDGSIVSAGGTLYGAPQIANFPDSDSSLRAVRAAVAEVNPRLAKVYAPFISSKPARHANAVAYSAGDFGGDIEGRLVWYAMRGSLQLAWVMTVIDQDGVNSYDVVVEEASGVVIGKQALTAFFQFVPPSPNGLIYDKGSPQPTTPGVAASAPPAFVERNFAHLAGDPVASPLGWVANNETAGNNVVVGENRLGGLIRPVPTKEPTGDFRFPLLTGPGAPDPILFADAANVNLFYWVNRAHDLHYQFGFDEAAGNFQAENFGRGGLGGDALFAYTHYAASATVGPSLRNAFFSTSSNDDGAQAVLAMFVGYSSAGGYFTDSALDASVIVHEYTHGVSRRLVRLGYTTFQGAAMGEAWSDFFALEYLLPDGVPTDGVFPAAEYYFNLFGAGIRSHPFSTRTDVNPLTYANLGAVTTFGPEVHDDGEIWVEALVEARANLIQQLGEYEGRRRIRFLVLDGMKLSVPAPSMVDMRDAILLADRVDYHGASQSQLWAAFAKRGLGALAYATSGNSVHVVPSFDLPSPTGTLKIFDDPLVAGESVRVVLADSNNSQPTARIQLRGSAGDEESMLLRRVGSVYFGTIPSSRNVVLTQNGTLNMVPGDTITATYTDSDPGSDGAKQIQTTARSQPAYTIIGVAPSFSFANETRITTVRAPVTFTLPFDFPFFSKKYRSMTIYPTGALGFGFSAFTNLLAPGCNDTTELARLPAVAPLFANLTFGTAQPNEGIYFSSAPGSLTIRWAAETLTAFPAGDPVNFAVTLNSDGVIQFFYGSGNASFTTTLNGSACGQSPVIGISNGHEAFTQTVLLSTLTNALSVRFEPPFNSSSTPVVTVERPARGETVRSVLTVNGIAYDPDASISRVDIFIDGVERAVTGATVARTAFCAQQNVHGCPLVGYQTNLDLAALGLAAGPHDLRVRATNTRGSITDFPDTPVNFIVDAAPGRLPKGAIEAPVSGATISGIVQFRGYAYFDDLLVRRVDLLIDGLTYPSATYGLSRPDICTPLSTPKPPNCNGVGWTVTFNTRTGIPPLPDGPHGMQLRVQDETGRFTLLPDAPVPIIVKNGAQTLPVGVLSSPKPNDRLSGTVTISGYAYSPGGVITSVFVLLDGQAVALASYGAPRPYECATLPGVTACPNIGFSATFDTRTVPNGPHVLGVFIRNDQGLSIVTPQLDADGMNVTVDNP